MQISAPSLAINQTTLSYQVDVTLADKQHTLWFKLDSAYQGLVCDTGDAALVALLLPAMLHGEDITVEGVVSETLLFNLQHAYQEIILQQIPRLHRITIKADQTQQTPYSATGVATGFSAGVDSFCTLEDYFFDSPPAALKVSHLIFNNVGSLGKGGRKLFDQRYDYLNQLAKSISLPLIKIDSNLETFYGRALDFQLTHSLRNISVAMLLQQGIRHFLYSSAYHYKDIRVGESDDMAYYDALALPLAKTESFSSISSGSEYERTEKTIRIANNPLSQAWLNVCIKGDSVTNCSSCSKCLRTLWTLEIIGKLHDFDNVFDLAKYQQHKTDFIAHALLSDETYIKELRRLAKQRAYAIPLKTRIIALKIYLRRRPKAIVASLKRSAKYPLVKLGLYKPKNLYY